MLVATAMMLAGLVAGIAAAQLRGLRLGGVIVVPLVTVYLLRSFTTFPVFVLSVCASYASLYIVTNRLLLFGRSLFVIAVVVGALVPVLTFEVLTITTGIGAGITRIEFIGSVLPGIAAFNYYRVGAEDRILDVVWSLTLVLFLTVLGIGLVIFVGLTPLAEVAPPMLLGPNSDIANAFGLVVQRGRIPVIASDLVGLGLVAVGLSFSEGFRSRYGLRIGGVIVVPLVVLASFRNGWMLPLWGGLTVVTYVAVQVLHWWTLLYGRVMLAAAVIIGLLTTIAVVPVVPVQHGLLPFFTGILSGVSGYNLHVVPPAERRATVFVTVAVLVLVAGIARLFIIPPSRGFLQYVQSRDLIVGVLACLPAVWELYHLERIRPTSQFRTPIVNSQSDGDE